MKGFIKIAALMLLFSQVAHAGECSQSGHDWLTKLSNDYIAQYNESKKITIDIHFNHSITLAKRQYAKMPSGTLVGHWQQKYDEMEGHLDSTRDFIGKIESQVTKLEVLAPKVSRLRAKWGRFANSCNDIERYHSAMEKREEADKVHDDIAGTLKVLRVYKGSHSRLLNALEESKNIFEQSNANSLSLEEQIKQTVLAEKELLVCGDSVTLDANGKSGVLVSFTDKGKGMSYPGIVISKGDKVLHDISAGPTTLTFEYMGNTYGYIGESGTVTIYPWDDTEGQFTTFEGNVDISGELVDIKCYGKKGNDFSASLDNV